MIQISLFWEDISKNLDQFEKKLEELTEDTDLIVLPEMFSTGFTMHAEHLAEEMTGNTMSVLRKWAAKKDAMIIGSFIVKVVHKFYNRLVCVRPDGSFDSYDKRHLFSLAKEDHIYTPGSDKNIVEWRGWKLNPLICYDLRFPVWSRNTISESQTAAYDVLIYVANWPEKRRYAWKQLAIARAIENQSYVIAVNRIGTDGDGFQYSGDSMLVDPMGEVQHDAGSKEDVTTLTLHRDELMHVRKQLQFLKDADQFEIQ